MVIKFGFIATCIQGHSICKLRFYWSSGAWLFVSHQSNYIYIRIRILATDKQISIILKGNQERKQTNPCIALNLA